MVKEEEKKKFLKRSTSNKVIGGVCGGLGEYFEIDPLIFRLLFVLFAIYGGSGLLLYIILWIAIPQEGEKRSDKFENNIKEGAQKMANEIKQTETQTSGKVIGGLLLVIIGTMFFLENVFPSFWFSFARLWPIILIVIGLIIIINSQNKE